MQRVLVGELFYYSRRALTEALRYWSDVSPLTFREVSGNADINVDFGSGDHGDGYEYSFDGPSEYC